MAADLKRLERGKKRRELVGTLRNLIVSGEFAPGTRFPTYGQLARRTNAGKDTLQYAIGRLEEFGFLRGEERRGLFVAPELPGYRRFVLLMQEADEHENRFREKVVRAAQDPANDFEFEIFRGMLNPMDDCLARLRALLESHTVGGVLVLHQVSNVTREVLDEYPEIPKAGFRGRGEWRLGGVFGYIEFDGDAMIARVVEELRSRGIRRLAILTRNYHWLEEGLASALRAAGITVPAELMLSVPPDNPEKCRNLVRLLMRLPRNLRPGGIFVFDDNLLLTVVPEIASTARNAGSGIPILSLMNFPEEREFELPVWGVGFDCAASVRQCVAAFRAYPRTGRLPELRISPRVRDFAPADVSGIS